MPATEASSPMAPASASPSASDRHGVHALALKLQEFWADNGVWLQMYGLLKQKLSLLSEILLAASPSFTTALLLWAMLT